MDIFTTAAAPAANLNVAPNPAFAKFEVGGTYWARSACNHDTLIRVTVAKRTAKTITTDEGKRLRVCTKYSGHEAVKPWGSYSMCPVVSADRKE